MSNNQDERLLENTLKFFKETAISINNDVDRHLATERYACKRGCYACCHQSVSVFFYEEANIVDAVKNIDQTTKSLLRRNIENWFTVFNKITPQASRANPLCAEEFTRAEYYFRENRIPCPLLHDGVCIIYDARPLVCRAHVVKNNAHNCQENPHRESEPSALKLRNFVANNIRYEKIGLPQALRGHLKPIAYLIADLVDAKVQSKPIFPYRRSELQKVNQK